MSAKRRRRKAAANQDNAANLTLQSTGTALGEPSQAIPLVVWLGAALVGFVVFTAIYGLGIVVPTNVEWLLAKRDPSTHFLGPHFFRHEAWHFPIGVMKQIHTPEGASIFFTDSVPLLAVVLKALSSLLPHWIQYIGLWILACFALNAMFGAALVYRLSFSNTAALLSSGFFALSPMLVNRVEQHSAGAAHWLVVAALWLYFEPNSRRNHMRWFFLTIAAAGIHSYMFAMVLVLLTAFGLKHFTDNPKANFLPLAKLAAACGIGVLILLWQLGYFVFDSNAGNFGSIGKWSMNLAAPFLPTPFNSFFLPNVPWAIPEQSYEGFAYFGFGALLLLTVAIIGNLRITTIGACKKHWPLLGAMIFFSIYATGHRFALGGAIVYDANWPAWLIEKLSSLRCNGRLFTPVYYMALAATVVAIQRWNPRKLAPVFISGALLLQVVDLWPIYNKIDLRASYTSPLKSPLWDELGKKYSEVRLVPPGNPVVAPSILQPAYVPFYLLAERHQLKINVFYLSRYDIKQRNAYAQRLTRDFQNGIFDPQALYIVQPEKPASTEIPPFNLQTGRGLLDGFFVIAP